MKRIRLWLRELSLSQQLLTILFIVISTLTIFIFAFLTPGINEFTSSEMYRMLHAAHIRAVYYVNAVDEGIRELDFSDEENGIQHTMYDSTARSFGIHAEKSESLLTEGLSEDIRSHLPEVEEGIQDFQYQLPRENGGTILYTISRIKGGRYLVTFMSSQEEQKFRTTLVNNIVNVNMLVAIVLFVILTVWITTIIYPLNQIKAYITKIKNDEPAELTVQRRDEIGEVADALRDMEEELQKQNREKEEMIQNISHDLKTPIATIRSYGESIKDGIYPYGTLEKSIDVIIEHADRLEKKVRSLIALNKMGYLLDDCEEGETLLMGDVIDKVLLGLKVIRPEITFDLDIDRTVKFHGDEDPWRIVIENLLDNALRYAKTTISITLVTGELKVNNDGSQIDPETLDKLFRPYEKGTDGQFGLGLSIVHRIVTTYGYKIEAENLSEGVSFRIWREVPKKEMRAIQKEKKKEEREKAKEIRRQERLEKNEKRNSPPQS